MPLMTQQNRAALLGNTFLMGIPTPSMWGTPSGVQKESSEKYIAGISAHPENYRVLERIPLNPDKIPISFNNEPQGDDTTVVVILDVETTGLGRTDSIIELGMARCRYDSKAGTLSGIDAVLDMLEDPGRPIPPEIVALTGITDEMVREKHIDVTGVNEMLRDDPIIVAHNAAFDRPFFERMFPENRENRWACTMQNIPWRRMGHDTAKLGSILEREGWFFEAHRAHIDCLATAWLLHVTPDGLHHLLAPSVKIVAGGNSYDIKEILKKRGYGWDGNQKKWSLVCSAGTDELAYLKGLYRDGYKSTEEAIDMRTAFR